jgi:hypothetical protein
MMKTFLRSLTVAAVLLLASIAGVQAQQAGGPVLVQQAPTRLDACNGIAYATAAVNNQVTATITVPGGLYAYVCGISADVCTNGTATVQSNVTFTTTNLPSLPTFQYSTPATANVCINPPVREFPAAPIKSAAPGTNVTVVSPAAATNNAYTIRVYYYLAP